MPSVKFNTQTQHTTTNNMPSSTSLQDISSHTQKFNWNKDQPLINLPESLLTTKNGANNRPKNLSQSNDRIFEHPEVTIKPTRHDDRVHRRLLTTTKAFNNENSGGSVPNILEHPDIRTPIVMQTEQLSLSSSSTSSSTTTSGEKRRILRQQSADVYSTLARTTSSPATNQINLVKSSARSNSPGSIIDDIVENPETEKSEESHSSTPPANLPTNKAPITIIREYSEASSTASDIDQTNKHSNQNAKPQSEEDDFW